MNKRDLDRHRATLETRRDEMVKAQHSREAIMLGRTPNETDGAQFAKAPDFSLQILDYEARLLRDVCAAIERAKQGEFGLCLTCNEEIPAKRLAALPWATYCIRCQEQKDAHQLKARWSEPNLAAKG